MSKDIIGSHPRTPHAVDLHVGAAVRLRRKFLGLSQSDLANAVDLSFQQVQKYERGANRVSASKLYQISQTLKMPIQRFFDGLEERSVDQPFRESMAEKNVQAFLITSEGIALAEAFPKIKASPHRRKILDLVRSLAEPEDE